MREVRDKIIKKMHRCDKERVKKDKGYILKEGGEKVAK